MDLFDSEGIYLVIVIAVFILVFFCIWLLNQSLKKPAAQKAKMRPQQKAKNPAMNRAMNPPEYQQEPDNYPADIPLSNPAPEADTYAMNIQEQGGSAAPGAYGDYSVPPLPAANDTRFTSPVHQFKPGTVISETPVVTQSRQSLGLDMLNSSQQSAQASQDPRAGGNRLWADISTDHNEEEKTQDNSGGSLMDIFQHEESEDDASTQLAAKLDNVDIKNLGELGKEISQYFQGRNPGLKKRG